MEKSLATPANITSITVLCSLLEEQKFIPQVRNHITVALSMILVFYLNQWKFCSGLTESTALKEQNYLRLIPLKLIDESTCSVLAPPKGTWLNPQPVRDHVLKY